MNYEIYHINTDTTLDALTADVWSPLRAFDKRHREFLAYADDDGRTNAQRITAKYSKSDLTDEATCIASGRLRLVKATTELLMPKGDLELDLQAMRGRNLFVKNVQTFTAFYGAYLDLLKNVGYMPAFRRTDTSNDIDVREYQVSVWLWSRAFSNNGTILLDVTRYVEHLSTTVDGQRNTFTLTLQAVEADAAVKTSLGFPVFKRPEGAGVGDDVFSRVDVDKNIRQWSAFDYNSPDVKSAERLPTPWFKRILQRNDIVFIRYERLAMELEEDRTAGNVLPASRLPGKVFDMIGLVDNVSGEADMATPDVSVTVTGGDLTRLLTEDGAYFFPLLFTENADTLFFNTQSTDRWFRRNFLDGSFNNLLIYMMLSVRDSLGFVINQLSNLGVCNDALFAAYDDAKTEGFGGRRAQTLKLSTGDAVQREWCTVSGIWQIVDLMVDEQIDDRRVANSQIANPNADLMGVCNSFCQEPFVEFYGDTFGDKFTFIARTPPYNRQAILDVLNGMNYIDVNLRDVLGTNLDWEQTFYTWFQMDPRNMFLGRSDSIALAYLPVVWFPEIAEAFGNKQLSITDNYISNKAITGAENAVNHDEFKRKVIEDFLYVLDAYCYLPFTRAGSITLKGDRRLKARSWVKVGNELFYITTVAHSFTAMGEKIDAQTTLTVKRGLIIDYVRGAWVKDLNRYLTYWSVVRLDVIRRVLIQKLVIYEDRDNPVVGSDDVEIKVAKNTVKASFGTDREAFDYFLQRRFLE